MSKVILPAVTERLPLSRSIILTTPLLSWHDLVQLAKLGSQDAVNLDFEAKGRLASISL